MAMSHHALGDLTSVIHPNLPFRLLPPLKLLQNAHLPLQRLQPFPRLLLHQSLIIAQFRKEVFAVRCRGHGGTEDGFHHEGVVGFERVAVGVPERGRELFGGVLEVVLDALGGEIETAVKGL